MKKKKPKKNSSEEIELLTAYDDRMRVIGNFPRPEVHHRKFWHRVVQCWVIGRTREGIRVYLQRRSYEKKTHPGRYDICAGGHVSAGETPMTAMLREIYEETGLILQEKYLQEIGEYREISGHDHEIATIYVHFEIDPPFYPGEEVLYMVSADLEDFKRLSEGSVNEITVVPAIRTGPMKEEAFKVGPENFCNHKSFLEVVYPYVREHCIKNDERWMRLMADAREEAEVSGVKDAEAEKASEERAKAALRALQSQNGGGLQLVRKPEGLVLTDGSMEVCGDFSAMKRRLQQGNLRQELLVKAAHIKGLDRPLCVLDATAGLGEDSMLLAAAGCSLLLYERNPVIAALLRDALQRAAADPELAAVAGRVELFEEDSIAAMQEQKGNPDVIYLDPMFPERQKSGLVKKKFQLLQQLEIPCADEAELLAAAFASGARRIVIKRPRKGAWLAGKKPHFSLEGKAIRYDCFVLMQK